MQTNPTYRISLIMHSDTSSISSFSTISMNKDFIQPIILYMDLNNTIAFLKSILSLYSSLHQLFFLIIRFSCNHINIIILLHSSLSILYYTHKCVSFMLILLIFSKMFSNCYFYHFRKACRCICFCLCICSLNVISILRSTIFLRKI